MQSTLKITLRPSHKWRLFFTCCTILLGVVGMLFDKSMSDSAHAATVSFNPLVTIAVDVTSPSCTTITTTRSHTTHRVLTTTSTKCPAGAWIATVNVPLSQAKAQHEPSVIYPSPHASHNTLTYWHKQIHDLMMAKREALWPKSKAQVTFDSCGYDASTSTGGTYRGTHIVFNVEYHLLSNCGSITINKEEVIGVLPVNTAAYWEEVDYAGWRGICPLQDNFIGSRDLAIYPGVTQPNRYYNVWHVDENNCASPGLDQSFSVLI